MDRARGRLCAVTVVFIWGLTFIASKVLLEILLPAEVLFFRMLVGFLALSLFSPKPLLWQGLKNELSLFIAGFFGIALYFICENYALTFSDAATVSIIISASPMITGLLTSALFKERLHTGFYIGFVLSMSGIILITATNKSSPNGASLGTILAISSAFAWALYSIMMKKVGRLNIEPIKITQRVFLYGLLSDIPIMLISGGSFDITRFQGKYLFSLLFLGLCASALCYVLWNKAIFILGPVSANLYIYFQPVITLFFSIVLLGNSLTPSIICGTLLIFLGMFISEKPIFVKASY